MSFDSTPPTLRALLDHKLLSSEDECRLADIVLRGRKAARIAAINELVRSNARLCYSIALKWARSESDLGDFFSAGLVGLRKAAERYNPRLANVTKARFATYASWYVEQAIRPLARASQCGASGLSGAACLIAGKIRAYQETFRSERGIDPSATEIAEALGLRYSKVATLMNYTSRVSLDAPRTSDRDEGFSLYDQLMDENAASAADQAELNDHREKLQAAVSELSKIEREVLTRRFGLLGKAQDTLGQIATDHRISRERVRQIEANGLRKLRILVSRRTSAYSELAA